MYPLVIEHQLLNIAIEVVDVPLNMAMFHSYVGLPKNNTVNCTSTIPNVFTNDILV